MATMTMTTATTVANRDSLKDKVREPAFGLVELGLDVYIRQFSSFHFIIFFSGILLC